MQDIEALVAHAGRAPGTDAERRAARQLEERLRASGRTVAVEPFDVWPNWPLAHLIHALAAVIGSLLAVSSPLPATIVLAVVALLTLGDLTGRAQLTRRLTGRRASQNVVAREDGGRPGTLVLVAHYDAGRSGVVYSRRALRRRARLGRPLRRPIGPFEPFFWAILVALGVAIVRLAGIETDAVSAVQFAAIVVLIVSVALLADVALSDVVPGASDNASGVATALRLADRYWGELEHFDVWVLFAGSGEAFGRGSVAFLRRHRDELDPASTVFVDVDTVGDGTIRYTRAEGVPLARSHHPALVDLCDRIAYEDADEDDRYGALSIVAPRAGDAGAARRRRYAAVSVSCRDELDVAPHYHQPTDTAENVDPDALDRAFRFCSELVELVDDEIGPRLAD
jgi:hypothetical protein